MNEMRSAKTIPTATASGGLFSSAKGDRYSYALGNGSYIVLEEVTNKTPARANESFISA